MIVSTGGIIAGGSAGGAGRHRGATVADGVRGDDAMSLAMSRRDRVRAKLADLKLPGALEAVDAVLARADGGGLSVAAALEELLDAQIELRIHRRLESARRTSRLPHLKTLADFDFSLQPSVERSQLESLHEPGFLRRHENVVFCGPPGWARPIWPPVWGWRRSPRGAACTSRRCRRWSSRCARRRRTALSSVDGECCCARRCRSWTRLAICRCRRTAAGCSSNWSGAPRARDDGVDDQQGLRGMGRGTGGRGDGDGDVGSSAASVPRGEHPGRELPHAGVPGDASGREPDLAG